MFSRLMKLGGFFPNATRHPHLDLEAEAATAYTGYVKDRTYPQSDNLLVKKVATIPALIKYLLIGISDRWGFRSDFSQSGE